MHTETAVIHACGMIDETYNSITTPIYASSIFAAKELGERLEFDYTRSGNPTRKALEDILVSLEEGLLASATNSGMSAIWSALCLLKTGDHLIASKQIYGGTHRILHFICKRFGIEITLLKDLNNLDDIKQNIKQNTKMVWIETPSNPLLQVTDIERLTKFIKSYDKNIICCADNTFLSPYFQKPLTLGCDVVIHSTTKYLNGHSDVIGGAVISRRELEGKQIADFVNCMGLACSPFDAWLVLRGIKTLPQRMEAHQKNAKAISEFLKSCDKVKQVFYPNIGGMLSFDLDTEKVNIKKFFSNLKYFSLAVSLGGVESLIAQPWSMSHACMPENDKLECGVSPSIIRVSAGIENAEDLINDLKEALKQ